VASPPVTGAVRSKARLRPAASSDSRKRTEEDVRRLVARELHDRVAQTLTGMLVDLENFKTEPVGWDDVLRQLDTVQDSTRHVLQSLRELLHDLRGEASVSDSFVDAVGALAARFEEKTRISAELSVVPGWPPSLTTPAALNLYRIVEEALANVRRHSGARAVRIVLEPYSDTKLSLIVGDDGRGVEEDPNRPEGMGTRGMKERAVLLGGELRIDSHAGDGTKVHGIFPRDLLIPSTKSGYQNHFAPKELQ
jgi:two-component system, NarL family, sensor histidine kinase UhpB